MPDVVDDLVDELFADLDVQRLMATTGSWQPLRVCYPKEINVSRFLAWLLDPSQGHGLGDASLRSLLTRAGQCDTTGLALNVRRFLAPSSTQTEAFASYTLLSEVDVGSNGSRRHLDVLAVDTVNKRYVAIENKFGAKEGEKQLEGYRKGLEKLLPAHLGIHIFLDSNEAEPKDSQWLPIGYDWLTGHLQDAASLDSVSHHVKAALDQFREVIEDEDDESAAATMEGRLITTLAARHPEALKLMQEHVRPPKPSDALRTLTALRSTEKPSKALILVRLFQLYSKRPQVWEQCFRQTRFAPFARAIRDKFSGAWCDPGRKSTTFSLPDWERFVQPEDDGHWYYPAGVYIRPEDNALRVVSYLRLTHVKPEKREALIQYARSVREVGRSKRKIDPDCTWVRLRSKGGLTTSDAAEEVVEQMTLLQRDLERVR